MHHGSPFFQESQEVHSLEKPHISRVFPLGKKRALGRGNRIKLENHRIKSEKLRTLVLQTLK